MKENRAERRDMRRRIYITLIYKSLMRRERELVGTCVQIQSCVTQFNRKSYREECYDQVEACTRENRARGQVRIALTVTQSIRCAHCTVYERSTMPRLSIPYQQFDLDTHKPTRRPRSVARLTWATPLGSR